jgi:predicted transcriptional regulator
MAIAAFFVLKTFILPILSIGWFFMTKIKNVPTVSSILKTISDAMTLAILHSITDTNGYKYVYLRRANLTKKQYYSKISGLLLAGLIVRKKRKYSLTTLGRVVTEAQSFIGEALSYYGQLKTIESAEPSAANGARLQKGQLTQLINTLLDNPRLKDFVIKAIFGSPTDSSIFTLVSTPTDDKIRHTEISKVSDSPQMAIPDINR